MRVPVVKGREWLALPLSAASLAFSGLILPLTYVAVPFCRPAATVISLTATVGVASGATALAFSGMFLSLMSLYTIGTARSRTSLAMSVGSLAIATAFIVFGLALRTCPT